MRCRIGWQRRSLFAPFSLTAQTQTLRFATFASLQGARWCGGGAPLQLEVLELLALARGQVGEVLAEHGPRVRRLPRVLPRRHPPHATVSARPPLMGGIPVATSAWALVYKGYKKVANRNVRKGLARGDSHLRVGRHQPRLSVAQGPQAVARVELEHLAAGHVLHGHAARQHLRLLHAQPLRRRRWPSQAGVERDTVTHSERDSGRRRRRASGPVARLLTASPLTKVCFEERVSRCALVELTLVTCYRRRRRRRLPRSRAPVED